MFRANESCIFRIFPDDAEAVKFKYLSLINYGDKIWKHERLPNCNDAKIYILADSVEFGPYCNLESSRKTREVESFGDQVFKGKVIYVNYWKNKFHKKN